MNTRRVGWFFLALLCGSMAQEWMSGADSLREYERNKLGKLNPSLLASLQKFGSTYDGNQPLESQTEALRSQLGDDSNVRMFGPGNNMLVICNLEARVALIFDIVNSLVLLCDGSLGTGILIDIALNVVHYCPIGAWNAVLVSLQVFVQGIDLVAFKGLITNIVVNLNNPLGVVLNLCAKVLGGLSTQLNIQVQANLSGALNLCINVCSDIITKIKVDLGGLLTLSTSALIHVKGGITGLIAVLNGLINIVVTANINIAALISANVFLSLGALLDCADGIQAFVYVFLTLGLNLASTGLANLIANLEVFLNICVQLGGNVYIGVTGVIQVVVAIVAYVNGTIQLDACLNVIIRVCADITAVISLTATIASLQSLISAQVTAFGNTSGLKLLIDLVIALQGNSLLVGNIDVSAVITLLCGGIVTTVLDLVINIVVCLTVRVSATVTVELYWATLLRVILELLNTVTGRIVIGILVNVNVSINLLGICINLLLGLLLTISGLLQILANLGLFEALLRVPVLARILNLCRSRISAIANVDLKDCLDDPSASSEVNKMSTWLGTINNLGC